MELDKNSLNEPSTNAHQYFYVVSLSPSYVEAFNFLCHSLCDVHDENCLRQWHRAHSKVFGALRFDTFRKRILEAPRGQVTGTGVDTYTNQNTNSKKKNAKPGSNDATTLLLPALFSDEASARLAFDSLSQNNNKTYSDNLEEISARQQNSCTPEANKSMTLVAPHSDDIASRMLDTPSVQTTTNLKPLPDVEGQWHNGNDGELKNGNDAVSEISLYRDRSLFLKQSATLVVESVTQDEVSQTYTRKSTEKLQSMITQLKLESEEKSSQLEKEVKELKELLHDKLNRNDKLPDKHKRYIGPKKNSLERDHGASIKVMETKLSKLEALYAREKESHARDGEDWQAEIQRLQEKLRALSHDHGENLYNIVKENERAMEKVNKQMLQKEEELRSMYEDAIQDRDIRLAQLSESLMKAEHRSFQLEFELRECQSKFKKAEVTNPSEDHKPTIIKGTGLQDKFHNTFYSPSGTQRDELARNSLTAIHTSESPTSDTHKMTTILPNVMADFAHIQKEYQNLEYNYNHIFHKKQQLETSLYNAENIISQQQSEIQNAAYIIESLKNGLDIVKGELPILIKGSLEHKKC